MSHLCHEALHQPVAVAEPDESCSQVTSVQVGSCGPVAIGIYSCPIGLTVPNKGTSMSLNPASSSSFVVERTM
ncbi:hypothetical protein J6590_055747 [Homalodisca vitripennis]|nr:hypothetical protein J6590_055747 [Homalodisca vitripennis]